MKPVYSGRTRVLHPSGATLNHSLNTRVSPVCLHSDGRQAAASSSTVLRHNNALRQGVWGGDHRAPGRPGRWPPKDRTCVEPETSHQAGPQLAFPETPRSIKESSSRPLRHVPWIVRGEALRVYSRCGSARLHRVLLEPTASAAMTDIQHVHQDMLRIRDRTVVPYVRPSPAAIDRTKAKLKKVS